MEKSTKSMRLGVCETAAGRDRMTVMTAGEPVSVLGRGKRGREAGGKDRCSRGRGRTAQGYYSLETLEVQSAGLIVRLFCCVLVGFDLFCCALFRFRGVLLGREGGAGWGPSPSDLPVP